LVENNEAPSVSRFASRRCVMGRYGFAPGRFCLARSGSFFIVTRCLFARGCVPLEGSLLPGFNGGGFTLLRGGVFAFLARGLLLGCAAACCCFWA
jgi:hypothetical protein